VQGSVGGLIAGFETGHRKLLMSDHSRQIVTSGSDLPVSSSPEAQTQNG
jgi:hypothetical protein